MRMNRRTFISQIPLLTAGGIAAAKSVQSIRGADGAPSPVSTAPNASSLIFQNAQLHNIDHLEPNAPGDGFRLSRVPHSVWEKMNAMGKTRSFAAAGAEVRFNLAGPEA